jgi:hypothetical protein
VQCHYRSAQAIANPRKPSPIREKPSPTKTSSRKAVTHPRKATADPPASSRIADWVHPSEAEEHHQDGESEIWK